jgi:alkylhydroperoxidase family enzyme
MPRIPYVSPENYEPAPLIQEIRASRAGGLLHIDRLLLHSAPFIVGWKALFRAVLNDLSVEPRLLELVICCVGFLHQAEYILQHHAGKFLRLGGSERELGALRELAGGSVSQCDGIFDARVRAVLRLAVEMTRSVTVTDSTFAAAQQAFAQPRQLVELIGVIAAYNMLARVVVATRIEPD